jgi:hypothetical protein
MAINKPFFVPQKEVDLIDAMNEELIDDIVGQTVDIYKITVEDTETNLYGESSTKYYDKGFRVNCLILYNEPEIRQDEFGPDVEGSIEMYFHRTTLKEAGFYPEIGDIVDWNRHYYEMNTVVEPQLIAGHHGFNHQIKAVAHKIKTSNLQIEERVK